MIKLPKPEHTQIQMSIYVSGEIWISSVDCNNVKFLGIDIELQLYKMLTGRLGEWNKGLSYTFFATTCESIIISKLNFKKNEVFHELIWAEIYGVIFQDILSGYIFSRIYCQVKKNTKENAHLIYYISWKKEGENVKKEKYVYV